MNIYVGNLDFKVSESELEELFATYGAVESCKIISDKYSGRSKGFAFVTMTNDAEANESIKQLNGTAFKNRDMVVNEAKPKKDNYNRF